MSANPHRCMEHIPLTAKYGLSGDKSQPSCDIDPSDKEALHQLAQLDQGHGDGDRTIDARHSVVESENA